MIAGRNMGPVEAITMAIHEKLDNACAISTITHIVGKFHFSQFKQALSWLFKRHPLLRATSVTTNGQYRLVLNAEFSDIPIILIETQNHTTIHNTFSEDAIKPFDPPKFLWRAYLIQINEAEHDMIIACSHATSDALCLASFSAEVLVCIEDIKIGKPFRYSILPMLDSVETLMPDPNPTLVPIKNNIIDTDEWQFDQITDVSKQHSRNLIRILAPEQVQQLVKVCKQHKTTVNAALSVAFCLSIMQSRDLSKLSTALYTAVNFRSLIGDVSSSNLICLVEQVEIMMSVGHNSNFWMLAAHFNLQLNDIVKHIVLPHDINKNILDELIQEAKDKFKHKKPLFKYLLSNVGVLDDFFNKTESLKVDSFRYTIQNLHAVYGISLFVSTLNNTMQLVLCFTEPMVSSAFAQTLANNTIKNLLIASQDIQPSLNPHHGITSHNEVEAIMCEIWQQLFEDDTVGVTDNFFELGGDFALSCEFIGLLEKHFPEHNLLPYMLSENPTIAQLSDIILI